MRMPNGYGSVVKLGGNRRRPYAVRKTVGWELVNGKARQIYKNIDYFETKAEAIIALAKLNDRKIDVRKDDYTFEAIYNEWLEKATEGKSDSTKKQIVYSFAHLESIKDEKIKDITESMIKNCIDNCSRGYSTKTVLRKIIQGTMQLAVAKAIRGDDPSTILNVGKQGDSDAHRPFTDDDLEVLRHTRGAEGIVLLAYTGMRIEELLLIEVANINLEERYMMGGIKSDAGKERIIPIHRSQVAFIKRQMKGKKKYLFEFKDRKMKYRYFRDHYWDNILEAKKMDAYTPHDARHTFVTNMRKAGVEKLLVQKIVGHKPKDVTERVYTHITKEELINAMDMLP